MLKSELPANRTCADSLVASLGRSKNALRASILTLAFNVASVCIRLKLYRQFEASGFLSPDADSAVKSQMPMHYSILEWHYFLLVTKPIAQVLTRLVPQKDPSDTSVILIISELRPVNEGPGTTICISQQFFSNDVALTLGIL